MGTLLSRRRLCTCLPDTVERYRARLSVPLLDRIDIRVDVPRIPYGELPAGEPHLAIALLPRAQP